MTRKPLFIRADAYAADVLKVFEKRRIDDLPAVDAEGKVVGLVDIQATPWSPSSRRILSPASNPSRKLSPSARITVYA